MKTLISIVALVFALTSPAWSVDVDSGLNKQQKKQTEKRDKTRQMDKTMDHAKMKPESMQQRDRIQMHRENMQTLMAQIRATDDPARRRELMQQHMGIMRDQMRMLHQQQDRSKNDKNMSMEDRMAMMEDHMQMMDMMMDHMMQREKMMDKMMDKMK